MSIDVTDVLLDPDLGGHTFTVVRATPTTGDDGRRVDGALQKIPARGSVQPASAEELQRLPEEERISGAIVVRTPFPLSAGKGTRTADEVWWNGTTYIVSVADPWPFGRGWTQAMCTLKSQRGTPTYRP